MMNIKYKLSPYCYVPESKMIYPERSLIDQCTREEFKNKFAKGIYGSHEFAVMEVIYKYGYINRFNIERVLGRTIRPNYKNLIKQMNEDEVIERYCYDDTILYAMTDAGKQFMYSKRNKSRAIPEIGVKEKERHPAKLLEIASMAQYHISIISSLNNVVEVDDKFYKICKLTNHNIVLPSYIYLKGRLKSIYIVGMPAAKYGDGMEFIDTLIYCDKILLNTLPVNKVMLVVVIVCTSISEIIKIGRFISRSNVLSNITPLYALDSNTAKAKGLKWVYMFQQDEDIDLISISIDIKGTLYNI